MVTGDFRPSSLASLFSSIFPDHVLSKSRNKCCGIYYHQAFLSFSLPRSDGAELYYQDSKGAASHPIATHQSLQVCVEWTIGSLLCLPGQRWLFETQSSLITSSLEFKSDMFGNQNLQIPQKTTHTHRRFEETPGIFYKNSQGY